MKKKNIRILVLGCTHYPIIEKVIKKVLPNVDLVNPGVLVAEKLKGYLTKNDLLDTREKIGKRRYYVTDLNKRFIKTTEIFLGKKLNGNIRRVDIGWMRKTRIVVLIEEYLVGKEVTRAVLGNEEVKALPVIEIVPKKADF